MKKAAWEKISCFESPEKSPGFLLWQVSMQWRRQIEVVLSKLGLTHPQFVLLASLGWLTRNQTDITQIKLARHCKTDINMTSQILRSLEQKGYVKRCQRKGNDRAKFPYVTKNGAQMIEQAIPLVEEADKTFFQKTGQECIKILQKLV